MYLYNPIEDIDKLKSIPQFNIKIDEIDSVLRYIIYLYDPESDLRKTISDPTKRKKEAARLANFKTTRSGGMTETTQLILLGKNKTANRMIVDFLKLFNSPWLIKYAASWALMEAEVLELLDLSDKTAKERETIRKNIKEITSEIDEAEAHLFGNKDTEALRNELFENMESEKADRLRPEYMAQAIESKTVSIGKNPFYPGIE